MLTVTDDWFPCYPNNQIKLSVFLIHFTRCESWDEHYMIKINAWGMDDRGVEIEKETNDYLYAIRIYKELLRLYESIPDGVNLHWFCNNGFSIA